VPTARDGRLSAFLPAPQEPRKAVPTGPGVAEDLRRDAVAVY